MSQFITSVGCSINSLTTEINELKHKLSTDEILLAHIFLKAQEIRRLEDLREVALSYAKFYRKDVVAEEVPQFLDDEEDDDEIQEDDDEMEEEEDEMQEDEAKGLITE
jgi:Ran GTPase-activating protein (RanGAP) involved in mRNA processing and transport